MKLFDKEKVVLPVSVLALACVLVVLAVLQYRWTQELNDAAGDRMRAGLQSSMIGLREDLGREFLTIPLALQSESPRDDSGGDADPYLQRLEAWKKTAAHPDLVANVFLAETSAKNGIELRQLNSATHQFEKLEWPSRLLTLRDPLSAMASDLSSFEHPRRANPFQPFLQHGGPHSPPWIIDESIPALLDPEIEHRHNASNDGSEPSSKISWVIVELNEGIIQQQILPELAQHFFGGASGLVYDVAVISRTRQNRLLYSSSANFVDWHQHPHGRAAQVVRTDDGTPRAAQRCDLTQRTAPRRTFPR